MVTRGYPSLTFLYEAAETIDEIGKPSHVYYFGDYDPSGVNIFETVERKIQQRTSAGVHIERIAVTPEQIERYSLPTRPTKKTDRRAGNFKGDSVELDAMPPKVLRQIVEGCIMHHIDNEALHGVLMAERVERTNVRANYHEYEVTMNICEKDSAVKSPGYCPACGHPLYPGDTEICSVCRLSKPQQKENKGMESRTLAQLEKELAVAWPGCRPLESA